MGGSPALKRGAAPADRSRMGPPEGSQNGGGRVDVSVLVAVLNEEAFVRETVAAMRSQSFDGRLEFLFVDGRSEDRTREILEELALEDPRIRILDNPARHLASALN